jgi:hypothetical protein
MRIENISKKAKNLSAMEYCEGGNLEPLSIPKIIRISCETNTIKNKTIKILAVSIKIDFIIIYLCLLKTASTSQHPSRQVLSQT